MGVNDDFVPRRADSLFDFLLFDFDKLSNELNRTTNRRAFIALSISHLFSTTYDPMKDDMSISTLLTYLNAAMPVDKYEDFDTSEVVKGVVALEEQGKVRFEGDLVRLGVGEGRERGLRGIW